MGRRAFLESRFVERSLIYEMIPAPKTISAPFPAEIYISTAIFGRNIYRNPP